MFKLMTIALLSSTIALGPCMATSEIVEDRQPITTENVKRATYDDNNYTITFSANELNNYVFNRFNGLMFYFAVTNQTPIADIYYNNQGVSSFEENYDNYIGVNYYTLSGNLGGSLYIGFNLAFDEQSDITTTFRQNQFCLFDYDDYSYSNIEYDLNIEFGVDFYNTIKRVVLLDIEDNQTPTTITTLFDSIYDYFNDKVFDSEYLNDYEMEIMGHNTSMRHYLCLTATIIFITLIVIFCVGFIVMLVKFVANMLINLGR